MEFALLSTVLLLMFAGGFDIVYMVGAKRDADRASMLIAHAMASCPDSSCISTLGDIYQQRKANALIRYPNASVEYYMIQNQYNEINPCSGKLTTLTDTKLITTAKNILRHGDIGSAVLVKTNYVSMFPNAVSSYITSSGVTYSGRTVDVMRHIDGALC